MQHPPTGVPPEPEAQPSIPAARIKPPCDLSSLALAFQICFGSLTLHSSTFNAVGSLQSRHSFLFPDGRIVCSTSGVLAGGSPAVGCSAQPWCEDFGSLPGAQVSNTAALPPAAGRAPRSA